MNDVEQIRLARLARLEVWELVDQVGTCWSILIDPESVADKEFLMRRVEDGCSFSNNLSIPAPRIRCLGKLSPLER